ncbi:MAG: hypothetical protein M3R13_02195 [Armatimonadota bacterium]|nr:hypothetical protein [Armatimonadota bacterium]
MRIHDSQNDTVTNNLILFLTEKEATQLIGALEQVLDDDSPGNHSHVHDKDYTHEITVTIARPSKLHQYDKRSQEILQGFDFDES